MNIVIQDQLGISTISSLKSFIVQDEMLYLTFIDGDERTIEAKVIECWTD